MPFARHHFSRVNDKNDRGVHLVQKADINATLLIDRGVKGSIETGSQSVQIFVDEHWGDKQDNGLLGKESNSAVNIASGLIRRQHLGHCSRAVKEVFCATPNHHVQPGQNAGPVTVPSSRSGRQKGDLCPTL